MPKKISSIAIRKKIYNLREQKVMFDRDLADLYGVETRALNQAVSRNVSRFPQDFMFRLTKDEFEDLRSQIVISSWGGTRYPPEARQNVESKEIWKAIRILQRKILE